MSNLEDNTKTPECLDYNGCMKQEYDETAQLLDKSYKSWYTLGLNSFSALSIGTTAFCLLTCNGFISLLSCNSVFSILSLNSVFSILSTNSAFSIGCVDKRFAICF